MIKEITFYKDSPNFDLVQVELIYRIHFNNFIQPICPWNSLNFKSTEVIIVGYEKLDTKLNTYESIPKQRKIQINNLEECRENDSDLTQESSPSTVCEKKGVCLGNSGDALLVKFEGSFYLRGIYSAAKCYTDVQKFEMWKNKIDEVDERCEAVTFSGTGLIQHGFVSNRTQFPWMAFIDGKSRTAGVLISHNHVIVPSSAVREYDDNIDKWLPKKELNSIHVNLGKININDDDNYIFSTIPSKIDLNPETRIIGNSLDATINFAILTLKDRVAFNKFIQPVCVWNQNDDIEIIENSPIYAVGYGNDESGKKSNRRKHTRVILTSETKCNLAYPLRVAQYITKYFVKNVKTFCVLGSKEGNPCHEDDVILVKHNGIWFFRGFSVFRKTTPQNVEICAYEPILIEDVAPHAEWIKKIVNDLQ